MPLTRRNYWIYKCSNIICVYVWQNCTAKSHRCMKALCSGSLKWSCQHVTGWCRKFSLQRKNIGDDSQWMAKHCNNTTDVLQTMKSVWLSPRTKIFLKMLPSYLSTIEQFAYFHIMIHFLFIWNICIVTFEIQD